jgi:hypothetical protein
MTTNDTYAVYFVTVLEDHTKDVEVLFKGTLAEAASYVEALPLTLKDNQHVQVLPWRAAFKERVAHGVGITDNDLRGNIHHLVNPVIGLLRMDEADGKENGKAVNYEYYISRLQAVIALADEYFGKYEEQREFEAWLEERREKN